MTHLLLMVYLLYVQPIVYPAFNEGVIIEQTNNQVAVLLEDDITSIFIMNKQPSYKKATSIEGSVHTASIWHNDYGSIRHSEWGQ